MADEINNKKDFYEFLMNNKCTLKFRKKDGSMRLMNATLNFDFIPSQHKPKKFDRNKFKQSIDRGIINVYDLDINDWRKVNYNTTEWIESSETKSRYNIKK